MGVNQQCLVGAIERLVAVAGARGRSIRPIARCTQQFARLGGILQTRPHARPQARGQVPLARKRRGAQRRVLHRCVFAQKAGPDYLLHGDHAAPA